MNVAMVGLTHPHSDMYLETLDQLDEVRGVSLCEPDGINAQDTRPHYSKTAGSYLSVESLLSHSDITHAVLAVRNDQSVEAITQLVDGGISVFAEKPAARTAAEFEKVLDALDRNPVGFCAAYLNRSHPAIKQMREMIQDHAIGRLTSVELRMVTTQVRFRNPRHWLFQREIAGGGILSWLGCHMIDLVRYLTSEEIVSVASQLATTSAEDISVEDTAAVSFRLSNGAIGSLHAGYLLSIGTAGYRGASYDRAIVLRGTEGAMTYRFEGPLVLESVAPAWRGASSRSIEFTLPTVPGYGGTHGVDTVRSFFTEVPQNQTLAGPTDTLRVLETLDAIYESNRSGITVEVTNRPNKVGDQR